MKKFSADMEVVRFGAEDTLAVPEEFQMACTDVRDHHPAGAGNPGQRGHVAEMAHPHLENRHFVLRLQAEYGQRKAELIVEVPLGLPGALLPGQDRRDHLLG